jgi:23S rRNA pseudouridine1911/1915/1917 synthase
VRASLEEVDESEVQLTGVPVRSQVRRGEAVNEWRVEVEGARLDKFLADTTRLGSRSRAAAALAQGKVFVNGAEVGPRDAGGRLAAGDRVAVWMDRPGSAAIRHAAPNRAARRGGVAILFEDGCLLVVDKPAGLLTVPLPRRPEAASVYALLAERLEPRRRTPHVVHRIDRDTSGLVVFAKDTRTEQALKAQFIRREPERVYLAVVAGRLAPQQGTWRDHLVWDRTARAQHQADCSDRRAVEAVSLYRTIEVLEGASVIEVRLRTGKRNQIRVQAALRGHPLLGERQYGPQPRQTARGGRLAFHRQALHAWRLGFAHPVDGRPLRFEAPLPADMTALIARLRPGPAD